MGPSFLRILFGGILLATSSYGAALAWRFGIIADTQWPGTSLADSLSGFRNPNGVAVDLLRQINREFIARGVQMVLATGDLSDANHPRGIETRATWTQPLYDAGIGFFPLRGNHDGLTGTASRFLYAFPQTRDGSHNRTPPDAFDWTDSATLHPDFATGVRAPFSLGSGFTSPSPALGGLSYAFQHQSATFLMLDQFTSPDGSANTIASQLGWLDSTLAKRPTGTHAFVLGHKGLITPSHPDNLFGATPDQDSASQHRFLRSLSKNGVRLYFNGHDHIQDRALITTPDDTATTVHTVTIGSASYKFYTPLSAPMDVLYDLANTTRMSRTPIAQELDRFTFSIVTVDGPRVEVETWSAPSGQVGGTVTSTPDLTGKWSLRERYGYALNGRSFTILQGTSYRQISDSGLGTRMRILGGTNTCTGKEYAGIPFAQHVTTGWSRSQGNVSATFSLWGMECGMGDFATPRYALSLSLDSTASLEDALAGRLCMGRLEDSTWIRGAGNDSATRLPQARPWQDTDPIGTWGVDTATRRIWAVLDRGGNLAIRPADALAASVLSRRSPPSPNLSGSLLQLPSQYANLPVTVELVSLDGRLLTRFTTRQAPVPLPSFGARMRLVRITAPGLRPAVLKYLCQP
ncbi:MAG: hypothetical protein RL318_1583 [Fibrobacterota bacterium]|jgi:hypothetical protein